jgi:hypothetical protein
MKDLISCTSQQVVFNRPLQRCAAQYHGAYAIVTRELPSSQDCTAFLALTSNYEQEEQKERACFHDAVVGLIFERE